MEEPKKIGRQTPTKSVTLHYTATRGEEAIALYEETGRTADEWQQSLVFDILAVDENGMYIHSKFGLSIPRQNGKNEIYAIVELYGITHGERILHTAHRVTTSSSAAARLATLLIDAGYEEVLRPKKDGVYTKHFTYAKQVGLEKITILGEGGGFCSFRTRTAKGGLGESYDRLHTDEAQEYTSEQDSSLKYVIAASQNPQTLYCGTPPTAVSGGDVFEPFRESVLLGETETAGWAEWSVDEMSDPKDRELWYMCNPSLGIRQSERTIADEVGADVTDFNIQRLGLWLKVNQKSEISTQQWDEMKLLKLPKLLNKMHVGIKYGADGTNTSVSIAIKTEDGKIFVEAIDCRPKRSGDEWLLSFLHNAQKSIDTVVIDGKSGQELLAQAIKDARIKVNVILPTVSEIVQANSTFENNIESQTICHMGQPSLCQIATNCGRRPIGTNGGFGYKSILEGADVSLLDSVILAQWQASQQKDKPKRKQISY